jgi:hypothetical protein
MKKFIACLLFLSFYSISNAQNEANSPYSLFGLGSSYETNFGSLPGLGGSGVALPTKRFVNNLNPASLSFIDQNSFLFDFGGKSSTTSYTNETNTEVKNNFYFSHIGFAFPITKKSGVSFALKPYTNSTYQITNAEIPIQGSQENYLLNVIGSGGLNAFDFSYGYRVHKNLTLGYTGTVLFGSIEETRDMLISQSQTTIEEKNRYSGLRSIFGAQFIVDSTMTVGATVKIPKSLKGTQVRSISTTNLSGTIEVETDVESDLEDYKLPLEFTLGISKSFKNLNLTADYERRFWSDTNMSDSFGDFTNQSKYSFGASYTKKKRTLSYFDKMTYNAGFSFDTGYLQVNGEKVENAAVHLGLGFPLENMSSFINLSYSYGQRGKVSESLIKENYHLISLNLSLEGFWFMKRKYD